MKLYLMCLLLLCGSQADDELPEDIASLLSDDLFQEIQKRLSNSKDSSGQPDNMFNPDSMVSDPGSGCYYRVTESRIIRTHDSINNGAVYIDSATDIQNKSACRSECCKHSECDLAVFKDKGEEHACYLFACGGQCLFTNHTGFSTMQKYRKPQQHEEDLANLATDPPSTPTMLPTTTTTTTTTTQSTTTPIPTQKKQPTPLFSTCAQSEDCAGTGTACLSGFCVCQQGFHAQEGVCREECSRFQFECANEGKPRAYPQCIAVYDQCDGITHCQDGSDELKCKQDESIDELARLLEEVLGVDGRNRGSNSKSSGLGPVNSGPANGLQPVKATGLQHARTQGAGPRTHLGEDRRPLTRPDTDSPLTHTVSPTDRRPDAPQHITPHDQRPSDQRPQDQRPPDQRPPDQRPSDQRPSDQRPSDQRPSDQHPQDQRPSDQRPSDQRPSDQRPSDQPHTTALPAEVTTKASTTMRVTSPPHAPADKRKPAISGGVVAGHVAHTLNDAASERRPSSASNRTAVVVLALGLAVTALLLIFVGCRLRMVKRRLRRGRPLNSNEADYLINGMYL